MWDSVFISYDPSPLWRRLPPPPPPRPVDDSSNRSNIIRDGRPRVVTITDQQGTLASYPLEEHFFDLPCKCDECKEFGSPPERPRPPPRSSKSRSSKRSGFYSPSYDSVFSDTPVRPHIFADLSFRDLPRPQPEGSDKDRAKGKLKALASDKGLIGDKLSDSDGKEECSSSSQSSRAAQGGSVQHEGSKGANKRIGPRGPISAAKGVDSSGLSATPRPTATYASLRDSAQRTGPKRPRRTTMRSELSKSISKHFKSPRQNGGFTYNMGPVYLGPPLVDTVGGTLRLNGTASTSRLEDADNTTRCKTKLESSKVSKEE